MAAILILAGIALVGFFITLWLVIGKAKVTKKKEDEFNLE